MAYTLHYFNGRGLAEFSRLLFAYAGVQYEDKRYEMKDWVAKKESMPFRKMPVLEVDGVQIAQSQAIERFLAKRFGLYGKDELEQAHIDTVCDQVNDIRMTMYMMKDDAEKLKAYTSKDLIEQFDLLEAFAKQHGSETTFVGKQTSWADIKFFGWAWGLPQDKRNELFTKCKTLKNIYTTIENNVNINKWLKERPQTAW